MTRLAPASSAELIRRLRDLGFRGPVVGGRHEFMIRATVRLVLPNPHYRDIGVDLLTRILREADVSREQWLGEMPSSRESSARVLSHDVIRATVSRLNATEKNRRPSAFRGNSSMTASLSEPILDSKTV